MNPLARIDHAHTARQYGAIAPHYQDWSTLPWREVVDLQGRYLDGLLLKQGIAAPARVLDLGCGKGTQMFGLAAHGHLCTGVDLSDVLIEQGKALADSFPNGNSVSWICGDLLQVRGLLSETPSFDAAISFGNSLPLLGSLENIRTALAQACGLLRPGGLIVLTGMDYAEARAQKPHVIQHGPITVDREGVWVETAEWMENGAQYISHVAFAYTRPEYAFKAYPFTLLHALTGVELRAALESAGFKDVSIETRGRGGLESFYICTAVKA